MEREKSKKNIKELPYRFTCHIPCEVVGHIDFTEEEEKQIEKEIEEVNKYFGLDEEN